MDDITAKMSGMIEIVLCDFCGDDWSERTESGGILFQSKATCPQCTPRLLESARKYNEEHFIRGKCPSDMSFADWVRKKLRAPDQRPGAAHGN